jgi:peptidoglycan/LPS O-acetylase OafA/YrhL
MDLRRLAYIDTLRGFAVTGVIASHVKNLFPDLHWRLFKLLEFGAHGVQLFFVASALTLMLSWHARNDGIGPFYLRRLFRIAPMFWLATALYGGLHAVGYWPDGGSDPTSVLATLFFVHAWTPDTINLVVPGGSTIGVEMTFYATFPLIAASITTLHRAMMFVGAAAVLAILANTGAEHMLSSTDSNSLGFFLYYWFPDSLQAFAVGCLTYHSLRFAPTKLPASMALLAVASFMVLACAWSSGIAWYPDLDHPLSRALATPIVSMALALALAGSRVPWLVNQLTCFVGRVSFSAYLLHFLVMAPVVSYLGPVHASTPVSLALFGVMMAVVMGVTVGLSAITYRLIEHPLIQAGSRFIKSRRPAIP